MHHKPSTNQVGKSKTMMKKEEEERLIWERETEQELLGRLTDLVFLKRKKSKHRKEKPVLELTSRGEEGD